MNSSFLRRGWSLVSVLLLLGGVAQAKDKADAVRSGVAQESVQEEVFARPDTSGSSGTRFNLTNGAAQVPVAVVRGTPYDMGWQLGQPHAQGNAGVYSTGTGWSFQGIESVARRRWQRSGLARPHTAMIGSSKNWPAWQTDRACRCGHCRRSTRCRS